MTDYDRHIPLEGAVNFRDLGGYETTDGRQIRWRTLFRADGLSRLTDQDRAAIRQLGVATVIDLRSSDEVAGGRFPVEDIPVGFHHFPLLEEVPDPDQFTYTPGLLASSYRTMTRDAGPQIAEILSIIARRHAHPVIVHCTAGKDRTGVLVAVLLGVLGVPEPTIIDDYALSGLAMAALRQKLIERYPAGRDAIDRADEVFSAEPANIAGLLQTLTEEYGSIADYGAAIGVGPDVVAELRETLLD
jgi:protein-tyrosine phosphatase